MLGLDFEGDEVSTRTCIYMETDLFNIHSDCIRVSILIYNTQICITTLYILFNNFHSLCVLSIFNVFKMYMHTCEIYWIFLCYAAF